MIKTGILAYTCIIALQIVNAPSTVQYSQNALKIGLRCETIASHRKRITKACLMEPMQKIQQHIICSHQQVYKLKST